MVRQDHPELASGVDLLRVEVKGFGKGGRGCPRRHPFKALGYLGQAWKRPSVEGAPHKGRGRSLLRQVEEAQRSLGKASSTASPDLLGLVDWSRVACARTRPSNRQARVSRPRRKRPGQGQLVHSGSAGRIRLGTAVSPDQAAGPASSLASRQAPRPDTKSPPRGGRAGVGCKSDDVTMVAWEGLPVKLRPGVV